VRLIPIPHENVRELEAHWLPHLEKLAARRGSGPELLTDITEGRTQVCLVWDGERTVAAMGLTKKLWLGSPAVEVTWCGGGDLKAILSVTETDLERYAREALRASHLIMTGRTGWVRPLRNLGWEQAQVTMTKDLTNERS
jgi:hypothetical protein